MTEALTEAELLSLLEDGLARPEQDRAVWLSALGLCAPDQQRLEKLLHSSTDAASHFNVDFSYLAQTAYAPCVGDTIGQFELVEQIGQGGMGQVYRARRTASDFEQEVAVKMVNPGLAAQQLVRLFRNERRLLAQLTHRNIARLLDGGEHQGTPYVVMEYVNGIPITEYVTAQTLSVRAILQLFLQVCDGAQAAHTALIIHRDLKPSNILVNTDGNVKILDFGIAASQANEDTLTDEAVSLTPDYASPEQIRGERLTSTSDVYSLGIVLRELLNDRTDTELVAIIDRATHDDASQRYTNAGVLGTDVRRYLDGYAIDALQHTRFYLLEKFVSRHRGMVALAALSTVLLVGGLIATLWQYRQADQERVRASQINQVLSDVILSPSKWSTLTHSNTLILTPQASVLDLWQVLEDYITSQDLNPDVQSEILNTLAESQHNLDRWTDTIRLADKVLAMDSTAGALPEQQRLRALMARTFAQHKSAQPDVVESYETLLKAFDNSTRQGSAEHAGAVQNYGVLIWSMGDLRLAEQYLTEAVDMMSELDQTLNLAYAHGNLGLLKCQLGALKACEARLQEAISLWDANESTPLASLHRAKASAYLWQRELPQALTEAQTSVEAAAVMYPQTLEHYRALLELTGVQIELGNIARAQSSYEQAERIAGDILTEDHTERGALWLSQASLALATHNLDLAGQALEAAQKLRRPDQPYSLSLSQVDAIWLQYWLARELPDKALPHYQRALRYRIKLLGEQAPATQWLKQLWPD